MYVISDPKHKCLIILWLGLNINCDFQSDDCGLVEQESEVNRKWNRDCYERKQLLQSTYM